MSPTDGRCTTSTDLDEMAAPHHFRIGARELPFFFIIFLRFSLLLLLLLLLLLFSRNVRSRST